VLPEHPAAVSGGAWPRLRWTWSLTPDPLPARLKTPAASQKDSTVWHTDIPSAAELRRLAALRSPGTVSIYLPTTPVSTDGRDPLTLRNLIDEAITRLRSGQTLDPAGVQEVEEELEDLLEDGMFWTYQGQGLAIFATPGHRTVYRLPLPVQERVHVSDRVHLKPLVSVLSRSSTCYVLALSENDARLIEVSSDLPPTTTVVPGLPEDAASAVGRSSIRDRSHRGRLVGSEGKRVHLRAYARAVDAALRPVLSGSDVPLVLAAVEPIRSIFRSVNSYPHLADTAIETSPDQLTEQQIAEEAGAVLAALFATRMQVLVELFDTRRSEGRVVTDIADAARAATAGAVETVVVDRSATFLGSVADDGTVAFDESTDDGAAYGVLDEIVRRVLLTGGDVLSVDAALVPGGQPVAAVLRWAP
jgi:hypothetical protein